VPAAEVPVPPDVAVPALGEGLVLVPALGSVVELVELVELVVLVLVVVVEAVTAAARGAEVGTVNGGAPEVFKVVEPTPPQADTPAHSARAAATADTVLVRPLRGFIALTGSTTSRAVPCACRSWDSR
jgi:hypothetical protein